MEKPRLVVALFAGLLVVGLSSCSTAPTFKTSSAAKENFRNCADRECFKALKFAHQIQSEPQAAGGERVVFAVWSVPTWEKHRSGNMRKPAYLYFEAYFDADGSASNINVGRPLCTFASNHQRNCIILSAGEVVALRTD